MRFFGKNRRHRRIAVLTNCIPVYRTPIFQAIASDEDVDLRIFLSLPINASDTGARKTLTLKHSRGFNLMRRTPHPRTASEAVEWLHIPAMLLVHLVLFRPDIVISGELGLRSLVAYIVTRVLRVPFIIWTEEISECAESISGLQRRLRSFLIPRANGFLAWGLPATSYLKSCGVPDERIRYCAQAVDNQYWSSQSKRHDKYALRSEQNIHGTVFLAVGRLVARKGFHKLIAAWAAIPAAVNADHTLIIVGGGPEEKSLQALAHSLKVTNVKFVGMQGPEQLARYYTLADVFVFPSLVDVWGLVVNEAMACGLPVLGSKHAGASQELICPEAGELFDPNELEEFTALLERWCERKKTVDPERVRAAVTKMNFEVTIRAIRSTIASHTATNAKDVVSA